MAAHKGGKEDKVYFDMTSGRTTRALILLDNGKVVGCALMPRTIAEENEDHLAIREASPP